ncbi:leishmanolysin-like peptidase isoform X1 [Eurytemora carolleeae]|uniref:leishmanolysin-like peptidase isoform X1 n=1 Tax=Eurytemora carolleeae TaxID=1294199 RepID=UPI000C75B9FB|nr:leishmanolysin-like peptidase isoform X1 [Eurytemora carolleeae]|eukprot:XP_023329956.1 leishmanolysin-like peptidase isoform X1 [Eurytemora affinis]
MLRDKDGKPLTERGEDGKPPVNQELQVRQWSDRIIKTVTRDWKVRGGTRERTVNVVVTPAVKREVQAHFNCETLEGAELEDQGGDGTAFTHWEKRIFQNEAMTGTVHTDNPIYSRLSLALMEDSGWYIPDYSLASSLSWGAGAGCDFPTKSCKELMALAEEKDSSSPFCNTMMQNAEKTYCTDDDLSVGSCNLVKYSSKIPRIYQNFDSIEGVEDADLEYIGSSVILADYCPYVQEFSWLGGGGVGGGEDPRGTRCDSAENAPDQDSNYALETYGTESRCFAQTSPWEQKSCTMIKQWTRYGSGCYKYSCADGRLNILVRDKSFPCYEEGQKVHLQLLKTSADGDWIHDGKLVCPACSQLCSDCSAEGRELKSHENLKEDLGDCILKAVEKEPSNELVGFFKQFGLFG